MIKIDLRIGKTYKHDGFTELLLTSTFTMKFLDIVSIRSEEIKFHAEDAESNDGEIILGQPDLLPVPPLPQGPRKWGAFHLAGYWIAEAFGTCSCYRSIWLVLISSSQASGYLIYEEPQQRTHDYSLQPIRSGFKCRGSWSLPRCNHRRNLIGTYSCL